MRSVCTRAEIAGLVVMALLVPAIGGLATTKKAALQQTRSAIVRIKRDLNSSQHAVHGSRRKIDAINARMATLQIQTNRLSAQVRAARSDVRSIQARIAATQARISETKHLAIAQARAMYEEGTLGALDALLGSTSLRQLNNRLTMLGVAAKENTGALIRYTRLRLRVEDANNELISRRNGLREKLLARRALEAHLRDQRTQLRARLGGLSRSLSDMHDKEKGLLSKADRIKKAIARAEAMRSVSSLGTSKQGYIWPLNGPITSPYGPRWGSFHPGVDIDGYTGEPYMAAHSGVVITAGWIDGYGNAIIIGAGGGIEDVYGHSSELEVRVGQHVKQGEIIGRVGCTGYCTGSHLHFEVRVDGRHVNPMRYLP